MKIRVIRLRVWLDMVRRGNTSAIGYEQACGMLRGVLESEHALRIGPVRIEW